MSLKQVSYPGCNLEGHASEPLSRLCVDQKCENKAVICCICEYSLHNGHKTVPVKHFLQQLGSSDTGEEGLKPLEYAKSLYFMKEEFFSLIARCRRDVLEQFQCLETRGTIYFNLCEESLLELSSISNAKGVFGEETTPKTYRAYFKKVLELYSGEEKGGFSLQSKYQRLMEDCKLREKKIIENIENVIKEFHKTTKKTQELLQDSFDLSKKMATLNWSSTLKGTKIKIEGALAEQTGMESSGQRFGLMDQPLPQTGKTRWGIKVKKFVGWVGVGICLKNSIKAANYHFNYTNIGHGSYLISTNGYSWSHSVKDFNSAFKTFQFTVNDIVYLEYDPKDSKLRFKKNLGNDKFELDVTPPPSGDAYHPCINLCSTGDAVELVFPGVPLS